ncbi:MAG: GAF domain-containing protein [Planctomycetota bacterium]|nr:MAG: GAF domain-containing protein [Planctomycetota bacterium]
MTSAPEQPSPSDPASGTPLLRLVDVGALKRLLDRFSALGRVTVFLCDPWGRLLVPPSWGSAFTRMLGTSPRGGRTVERCLQTCIARGEGEDEVSCLEGLSLCPVPIAHAGRRLALLVVGWRTETPREEEALRQVAKGYGVDEGRLRAAAVDVDPFRGGSPDDVRRFAEVLAETIGTMYAQAARIEQQIHDLQAVHSFTELLTGPLDLQEILDRTARRVVEVMKVKASSIRLLNRETGELELKAVCNLSDAYLKKGPIYLHENAIDAQAFSGQTVYIPDVPHDPRIRYPEHARREGIVSGLCVPMAYRGETVGVIRVYMGRPYHFTEAEEAMLRSIASQTAAAIINVRLWREHLETVRMQRQVEAAAAIQARMFPAGPPQRAHLQIGAVYDATLEVSGDFYDFVEWEDGRLAVVIADVVGKGIPAALMMASIRASLRANLRRFETPGAAVRAVNRHLCRDTLVHEFASLFCGLFSADGGELTFSNAGHLPPLLLRDGAFAELDAEGMVIGVDPEVVFAERKLSVCRGDVIVMVTDGVTEAINFDGEAFGSERLRASIRRHAELEAEQLARQILWDVRRFVGLTEQSDDITIVAIKAA